VREFGGRETKLPTYPSIGMESLNTLNYTLSNPSEMRNTFMVDEFVLSETNR
jgi:hypothetical protein